MKHVDKNSSSVGAKLNTCRSTLHATQHNQSNKTAHEVRRETVNFDENSTIANGAVRVNSCVSPFKVDRTNV